MTQGAPDLYSLFGSTATTLKELMAEDKKTSESNSPQPDLKSERDRFVKSFTRGSRLTDEFIQDYERLLDRLAVMEAENANLRAQVAADRAVRDLVQKIEMLEAEKSDLLSRTNRAEAINTQFTTRVQEVESEFSNLANLYVASNQLHSSLSPRGVTRRIKEVLAQLVGAERYSMYLANQDATELVPIASEGVPGGDLLPVPVAGSRLGDVLLKGEAVVEEDVDPSRGALDRPAAVIPLVVDERVVGVIAIFSTLSQKTRFDAVDFELFRLLGQHAAQALVSASLFAQAERRLPGLEAFLDLSV
jgi:putative methionine-R-sulfoxide reductase with GAF domain